MTNESPCIDVEVTDVELKTLGFEKFSIPLKGYSRNFFVWYKGKAVTAPFKKGDLAITTKALEKTFVKVMGVERKVIQKFILFFVDKYQKLSEKESFGNVAKNMAGANEVHDQNFIEAKRITEEIKKLKEENSQITFEKWREILMQKYQNLKQIAEKNFPHSWPGIEFTLSVLKILNIAECTLPFAGIMLARAGANKTLSSELITFWPLVYYTRKFTPKAFVSNSTSLDKDQLLEVDMLPRIRFKLLLTPELTTIFSANEDELRENLGIITSVLDGHGLVTDSGAHGRRGYHGNYMFVWVGAAVDIPYRVHKLLATLGPKLYFFRLPYVRKTNEQIIEQLDENFEKKKKEVQSAVIDFLIWHEINPNTFVDKEETMQQLTKIKWNSEKDEVRAKQYLANLGELLGRLRGHVDIWAERRNSFKEHEYSEYSYSLPQPEDPARATTQLYNIARGHALLEGRNSISLQRDLPIAIKVALSTASIERVAIVDFLLARNGEEAVLSDIANAFSMSKSTALKAMTELTALQVVNMGHAVREFNETVKIVLKPEFKWLFGKEFKKLREGFAPVDNSQYTGENEEGEEKGKNLTIRETIVLAELKKLAEFDNTNNIPVPKQLLFDNLKADNSSNGGGDNSSTSFVDDDHTIDLAIGGLVKKGKLMILPDDMLCIIKEEEEEKEEVLDKDNNNDSSSGAKNNTQEYSESNS